MEVANWPIRARDLLLLCYKYIFVIHPSLNIFKNVIVGTIYRPPDENVSDFLDSLRKLLSTTTGENKICYVMGDFNLDLLRHEQDAITGEFVELMFSHLLYSVITKPTRITSNTTSLIDNIFTNKCYLSICQWTDCKWFIWPLVDFFQLAVETLITALPLKTGVAIFL